MLPREAAEEGCPGAGRGGGAWPTQVFPSSQGSRQAELGRPPGSGRRGLAGWSEWAWVSGTARRGCV